MPIINMAHSLAEIPKDAVNVRNVSDEYRHQAGMVGTLPRPQKAPECVAY